VLAQDIEGHSERIIQMRMLKLGWHKDSPYKYIKPGRTHGSAPYECKRLRAFVGYDLRVVTAFDFASMFSIAPFHAVLKATSSTRGVLRTPAFHRSALSTLPRRRSMPTSPKGLILVF
jgi:hypothetical protein